MKFVLYILFGLLLGFLPNTARAETCGTDEYDGFIYPVKNHSIIPGCEFDGYCNDCFGPHHMAVDIIPSIGSGLDTPVYSPCSGLVKYAGGEKQFYGGMVILECLVLDECVSPFMAHLYPYDTDSQFPGKELKVKTGDSVKVGQLLGYIAPGKYNGGFGYNLHTHFGIRKGYADIAGSYQGVCGLSLWNYTGYATKGGCDKSGKLLNKDTTCYPYVLADMYDPVEFIDKIVPEKEAKLLGSKPFTPPYDGNAKPCLNVTGSEGTNWVFSCKAGTEWLKSYTVGSNVAVLAEVKNVTADHRFVAQRYLNGEKFGAVEETAWASVGSGWPQSQTWPTVLYAVAGLWKMDIWFEVKATGQKIPLLPSVEFLVGDISDPAPQSKESFQLIEVSACTSINWGNAANGWTYTCTDAASSFVEGTVLVYVLAKIENAIQNFRFRTEKYMKVDGILVKQGEADKSQYINVGVSGWDKAYTWPRVYKPKAGVWVFDFFIDFEDGSESKHLGIHTFTIEKKPELAPKPAPSVSGGGSWACLAKNVVSGSQSNEWMYTCASPKDVFVEDEDVVVLAQVKNIPKNFKFKTKKFWKSKSTAPIIDEMGSFINVGTGWAYAYTWPTVPMWQDGVWYFEFLVVFEDGTEVLFEEHTLTMQNKAKPTPPPQPIPSVPYVFGNTETCLEHQDGVAPNWDFSCANPQTVFTEGDMVFVVTTLKQVAVNHQIKTVFIKDGAVVWTNIAPTENTWGIVAPGTVWNTSFSWPRKGNVLPGNWEADILVKILGEDFKLVHTHPFTVLPKGSPTPPFVSMGADACTSMDGPNADWQYWCVDPKIEFPAGSTIVVVAGIEQVFVDHYFKTVVYANGAQVGDPQTSGWTYVGEGWDYAFTWPTVSNVWVGTWEFRVYLVYKTKTGDIEVVLLENVVVKVK